MESHGVITDIDGVGFRFDATHAMEDMDHEEEDDDVCKTVL